MASSNLGREIGQLLDDVTLPDLQETSKPGWIIYRRHPHDASCDCPAIEILARLYELGYRIVREQNH